MKEENILHGPPKSTTQLPYKSLGELLLNQLIVHGSNVAQVNAYTGEEQTFKEILIASQKLATALQNKGLQINDRVAVCSENNGQFCIPVCATLYLGATVCPLNPLYTTGELIHSLNISKPKFIFVSSTAAKNVSGILDQLPWCPELILLTKTNSAKLLDLQTLIANVSVSDNFHACPVDIANHVAVISCSSGTTGLPKGVMLTDKNLLTILKDFPNAVGNGTEIVALSLLPFFHIYAFAVLLIRLVYGNKNIILSRFDEKVFLRTIEKYKIQVLTLVPPLLLFLAKHPLVDKYDLSCVKEIWSGAAPLSKGIAEIVMRRLGLPAINQGYGLTETTLGVTRTTNSPRPGSVGKLVPGVSAKVIPVDGDTRKALGPNLEGELCFKGDIIMKGYCNDEKSTAATIDQDGWLHTGDIGYYDEDGYFYVVDRIKELIKYKGFQVPPAELERILLNHSEIQDAAVVGLPNEEAGELPTAFVVKSPNSKITEEEVVQYVNERVSNQKRLRGGVKFVESIPKTASGKILRRVLKNSLKSKL